MNTPLERALNTLMEVRKRTEGHGSVWGSREILRNAEEDLHQALDANDRASQQLQVVALELEERARKLRQIADAVSLRSARARSEMFTPPPPTAEGSLNPAAARARAAVDRVLAAVRAEVKP